MSTTAATFTAHGHEWQAHTPGDPCPVDGDTRVVTLSREEMANPHPSGTFEAAADIWNWDENPDLSRAEIIGWRYATEQAKQKEDEPSEDQIQGWVERNGWSGSVQSAKTAIDDARSLHNS